MKTILIIVGSAIFLWAAYYFIAPFFNIIEVNDPLPESVPVQEVVNEEVENEENIITEPTETDGETTEEIEDEIEPVATPPEASVNAVVATKGHPASGEVKVLSTNDGKVIRYENFSTINGQKLHLYLANDLDAEEYVDLGPIKGTKGDINYTVPNDIDLSEYKYVMYWCVPFGVLFNYAELN